jgi:hypothetical protein
MDKEANGLLKSIKVISEIILVLLAVGMAFVTLRERVKVNSANIEANARAVLAAQKDVRTLREETKDDIATIKSDIRVMSLEQTAIKTGVDEIKEKLDR